MKVLSATVLPAAPALGFLALLGWWNFLLFHSLAELFAIVVSGAAFLVVWNLRNRLESGFQAFLATGYGAVAVLDLVHLLAYQGMAVFPDGSVDLATRLWMAARFLQAFTLVAAPSFIGRRVAVPTLLLAFLLADAFLLLSIFRPWPFLPAFPACFVEGADPPLTRFKVAGEYVVVAVLGLAMVRLRLGREALDRTVYRCLLAAMAATIGSELFFTGYRVVTGPLNMAGHLLKAVAFFLAYKALVEASLVRPFEVLFQNASQSRQQALESEERFRTLSAATFEGIAITENGRIVDVNEQLLEMLGRTREEMIGEPVSAFLVPEDRERVLQSIREGLRAHVDYRMLRRDGAVFHVETHGKMVHFRNRTVRVTAIRDITERRRIEESVMEARNAAVRTARDLARSNRDLEQYAHVASHDLKEPLRMVTGFLSLLLEKNAGRLDEEAKGYVRFAADAALRMQQLVDDLLEYARAGRGGAAEPVPLDEVLDEVLRLLEGPIREAGARIVRAPLPAVRAVREEMVQLLQNLLSNAVKFRGPQAPVIRVEAARAGEAWEIAVRDNGIGIDPVYRERIFEIFQRLHPAEDYPGSGVGLAICKKIVEHYGGEIRVESEPGRGASFLFTLPGAEP